MKELRDTMPLAVIGEYFFGLVKNGGGGGG